MSKIQPPIGYRWKVVADQDDDYSAADPQVLWVHLQKSFMGWGFWWISENCYRLHWETEKDAEEKVEEAKYTILEKRQERKRLKDLVTRLNS